jgi:hypothetical protein
LIPQFHDLAHSQGNPILQPVLMTSFLGAKDGIP